VTVPGVLAMGRTPLRENCHEENSRQSSSKDACTTSGLGSRGARRTILDGVLAAFRARTNGRTADSKRVPPSQRELVTQIESSGLCGLALWASFFNGGKTEMTIGVGNLVAIICIVISVIFAIVTNQATNALWWALLAIFAVLWWGARAPWGTS
jgi:hypothetical protein